ncbi:hypothetical protein [Microbacterium paraoxydans]|uniref:hypothetical protein n=1 Tax=Microbacterium paraoxydans TaxID=199592 RepID=UPI001CFBECE5|nr:hypothetical protein [Microbacterium paraoxydans]
MTTTSPWPESADTVTRWVRASIRPDASELEVRGLEDVRVSCELDGDDLEHLTLDASAVDLRLRMPTHDTAPSAPVTVPADTPEVRSRRAGTARTIRLIARPVRVERIPVVIDAQVYDAPIEWLVYATPVVAGRPESRFGIEVVGDGAGMRGSFLASLAATDLPRLLTAVLRPALKAGGVRLRRLTATVVPDGPDGVRIDGAAGVRWRIFPASARATARIDIDPSGIITVRDVRVTSGNLVVALALRAVRRTIRAQNGRTYDLNDELGFGETALRLHDVRLTVADQLTVAARLG